MFERQLSKEDLLWDEKVVDFYEIGRSIRGLRASRPMTKIGFYASDFDDLTPADCVFLQLCRTKCDILVVAAPTDYSMRLNKKTSRHSTQERLFRMGSMVYVNYIVPYDEETCGLCIDAVDPDFIFYGRAQGDEERYSTTLNKDKLTLVDYPWREERIEGNFFQI